MIGICLWILLGVWLWSLAGMLLPRILPDNFHPSWKTAETLWVLLLLSMMALTIRALVLYYY